MRNRPNDPSEKPRTDVYEEVPADSPSENYLVVRTLQRMPSIYSRGILYIVLLFAISAVVYAILSKIDVVVESHAVARPVSHMMRILSDRDGYIEKIFITEGQAVKKNDPLFLIRSKEILTYQAKVEELRRAIPLKQQSYETRIASIEDELAQLQESHRKFIRLKNLEREQNDLTMQTIDSEEKYSHKEIALYLEDLDRVQNLYEKGVLSVRELNFSKVRVEKARTELEKILSKKLITSKQNAMIAEETTKAASEMQSRKRILEKQIDSLRLELETTLNSMQNELVMNEKKLSRQDLPSVHKGTDAEKMVRAENSGLVSELFFRNTGDYVRESDLLCTMLPDDQPLYMDITVANKDIGFIEPGLPVKFKFDAFPYMDYGVLVGRVTSISPAALESAEQGLVYRAQGVLDNWQFVINEQAYAVRPGMTAVAEIITEKKSIFAIVFQKFKT
jgi:HlyD family type I secretion membrane fusion protein